MYLPYVATKIYRYGVYYIIKRICVYHNYFTTESLLWAGHLLCFKKEAILCFKEFFWRCFVNILYHWFYNSSQQWSAEKNMWTRTWWSIKHPMQCTTRWIYGLLRLILLLQLLFCYIHLLFFVFLFFFPPLCVNLRSSW